MLDEADIANEYFTFGRLGIPERIAVAEGEKLLSVYVRSSGRRHGGGRTRGRTPCYMICNTTMAALRAHCHVTFDLVLNAFIQWSQVGDSAFKHERLPRTNPQIPDVHVNAHDGRWS